MDLQEGIKKTGKKLAWMEVFYRLEELKWEYANAKRVNDKEQMESIVAEHKRMSELFQKIREERK